MLTEYEFDVKFEKRILSLFIRKPEIRENIKAEYFQNPILMDICRLVSEVCEKHPGTSITEESVRAVVKGYLGKKRYDAWKTAYKPIIKELFSVSTSDDDVIAEQADLFAKERKFRKALVSAESDINSANYDAAIKRFVELTSDAPSESRSYDDWPKPLCDAAFQGLAGDIVNAILPNTEADAAGLLLQLLVGFGNIAGRNSYARVGSAKHFPNLFCALVGRTAKARKGTAWNEVKPLLRDAEPVWAKHCILPGGLASGEGLIWSVRDSIEKSKAGKHSSKDENETEVIDKGVDDKRRLIVSTELSSPIRVMQREGNILSETIRQAFDSGDLNNQSKNSPARATGAHISIIGHITQGETLKILGTREGGNGFVNRFVWVAVQRSKILSDPPRLKEEIKSSLVHKLRKAVHFAQRSCELKRSPNAAKLYDHIYRKVFRESPGLIGDITARGDAHVLRLSLIYALLDHSPSIRTRHLDAALAVWKYCEASARFIFGETLGDLDGEKLLKALHDNPKGMARSQISSQIFQGHRKPEQLNGIFKRLRDRDLIVLEEVKTDGRSKEIWKVKRSKGAK